MTYYIGGCIVVVDNLYAKMKKRTLKERLFSLPFEPFLKYSKSPCDGFCRLNNTFRVHPLYLEKLEKQLLAGWNPTQGEYCWFKCDNDSVVLGIFSHKFDGFYFREHNRLELAHADAKLSHNFCFPFSDTMKNLEAKKARFNL